MVYEFLLFVSDTRLHDFVVGLSMNYLASPMPGSYSLCSQFAGVAGNGQNVTMTCNNPDLVSRYVIIQIPDRTENLHLCEVKVEGAGKLMLASI